VSTPRPSSKQLRAWGVHDADAGRLQEILAELAAATAEQVWQRLCRDWLSTAIPFAAHRELFELVYRDRAADAPPAPAWLPSDAAIAASNAGRWMRELGLADFQELHAWSIADRPRYWQRAIDELGIVLHKPYDAVLDATRGVQRPRWLPGAQLNIVDSCLHPDEERPALRWSRDGEQIEAMSAAELARQSDHVARSLRAHGLQAGDAVAMLLPMRHECVPIYLGIIKAGCAVVSIADSFGAEEIAVRLRIAGAKMVITQEAVPRGEKRIPLFERVVAAQGPPAIVLDDHEGDPQGLRAEDQRWRDFLLDDGDAPCASAAMLPEDHCNILFSSGTTGEPKAIPWTHVTPIKCAADAWAHFDIRPGDVLAWPSNMGWMMGPWLIFAALISAVFVVL